MARRVRLEYRKPGSATVEGRELGLFDDKEKVKLLIVRGGYGNARQVIQACTEANMFPGAVVMCLPHGAEFEVWEET